MIDNGVQIIIHIQHLRANIRRIMTSCQSLLPIIKTDAYGHGIIRTTRALEQEGVDLLAVGTVGEGARLRRAGIRAGLVALLGALDEDDARQAAALDIMPLVHSFDELARFAGLGAPADVVLKCDTGMGRLGFAPADMPRLIEALRAMPLLHPQIVLSHLACADEESKDETTIAQARAMLQAVRTLRAAFPLLRASLLNSPGLLVWPELVKKAPELTAADFGHELARPGLVLYGENPLYGTGRAALGEGFLPVMEARTTVLAVREVRAGQSLSYGHTFTAPRDMRVAIIAAGYAEGYPRALSNCGFVALRGGRAPIIGRVCMQMAFIDVSALPTCAPGDPVWLLGGPEDGSARPVTASELAAWSGMIPYEFLCALGKNERVYVD